MPAVWSADFSATVDLARLVSAFAALGGVAPLPAASRNTTRHRLSRSGDRQLNRAFDVVADVQGRSP
jgi:transposase